MGTVAGARPYGRTRFSLSAALFVLGTAMALGAGPGIVGVDLVAIGAAAMLIGMLGLVVTGLMWAAQGPGALQDNHGTHLARRQRHRVGRT